MAPFMEKLSPGLRKATGAEVEVHEVVNEFFGELVTVAGLLSGRDMLAAVSDAEPSDLILLPREALNADELFIDSFSLAEFRDTVAPAQVIPAFDLIEALGEL